MNIAKKIAPNDTAIIKLNFYNLLNDVSNNGKTVFTSVYEAETFLTNGHFLVKIANKLSPFELTRLIEKIEIKL